MRIELSVIVFLAACSDSSAPPPNPTPERYYVANKGSSSISAFNVADTGNVAPALTIGGTNTTLDQPVGIVVDPAGVVITTSYNPPRIVVFAANAVGEVTPIATIVGSNTRLTQPTGLALDQAGRLFVANTSSDSILVFGNGARGNVPPGAAIGGSNTLLNAPEGIALDLHGKVYVTHLLGNSVVVFGASAIGNAAPVDTIAGPNTGLDTPVGIALDPGGRLYVANYGSGAANNSSVTVFAAGAHGNATPLATIKGDSTGLDQPVGIGLDAAGRIYVASSANGSHQYRITVYAHPASGNVAPLATIAGTNAGLSVPSHLSF